MAVRSTQYHGPVIVSGGTRNARTTQYNSQILVSDAAVAARVTQYHACIIYNPRGKAGEFQCDGEAAVTWSFAPNTIQGFFDADGSASAEWAAGFPTNFWTCSGGGSFEATNKKSHRVTDWNSDGAASAEFTWTGALAVSWQVDGTSSVLWNLREKNVAEKCMSAPEVVFAGSAENFVF